jgi:hypothetical protein
MSNIREFEPKPKNKRYRVEYLTRGRYPHWLKDGEYRTYFFARLNVSVWNSIGRTARIIDSKGERNEA